MNAGEDCLHRLLLSAAPGRAAAGALSGAAATAATAAALAGDRIFHHLNALSAAEKDNHGKNRDNNQIAKDR